MQRVASQLWAGVAGIAFWLALASILLPVPAVASLLVVEVQGVVGIRSFAPFEGEPGLLYRLQETGNLLDDEGNIRPLPSLNDYQLSEIAVDTPVSVRFEIDTSRMPAGLLTDFGVEIATLGPSSIVHSEGLLLEPWIRANLEVEGQSFGFDLSPQDLDPLGFFPMPPNTTNVVGDVGYAHLLSYGQEENILTGVRRQAFRAATDSRSGYNVFFPPAPSGPIFVGSLQIHTMNLRLFDGLLAGEVGFLGDDPFALPVNFHWTDDDIDPESQTFLKRDGFLTIAWRSINILDQRELQDDGSVKLLRDYDGTLLNLGMQVTSVRAYMVDPEAIPEPASASLAGLALLLLGMAHRRRRKSKES
ncbi:MAG: hypothetical protein KIT83_02260 [Bryobacterales bacterium]|nr:hypothetical protein [Bryobacterales bacterium]